MEMNHTDWPELDAAAVRERDGLLTAADADDAYWGEIPQDQFGDLLAQVEAAGDFDSAVTRFFASHRRKDLYPYITDTHGRGAWHQFLKQGNGGVAVDLGAGMGGISAHLAQRYGRVYAIEGCADRCRLMQLRRRLGGPQNLQVIHGSMDRIPLRDGCADTVACNGVLEWAALNRPGRVRRVQRDFLREAGRVLKDDGILYVGIENRFARLYFKGKLEDHSGLKYTSLMPRWLAGMACAVKSGSDFFNVARRYGQYRTWTYSFLGYRRLLRAAGFRHVRFICSEPSYDLPHFAFPLDAPIEELDRFARVYGLPDLTRWVRRYLCTNFLIFASRQPLEGRIETRPTYFGYYDTMRLEAQGIQRTDLRGEQSIEPLVAGRTLLKQPAPEITAEDLHRCYGEFPPSQQRRSDAERVEAVWPRLERFVEGIVPAEELRELWRLVLREHVDRTYHGDFWVGNIVHEEGTGRLVMIDPERQTFGSPKLDAADFVLDVVMNDRAATFPNVDLDDLCRRFGIDRGDRALFRLAMLRQVLRYTPLHRPHRLVYRFMELLKSGAEVAETGRVQAAA